jgi:hypothetical protein
VSPDQLKANLEDLITILQALDRLLPNRIEGDLILFLQSVTQHEWLLGLLLKALEMSKQLEPKSLRR